MDSRTSSILLNLDIDVNAGLVANCYGTSKSGIAQAQDQKIKSYKNLRSTLRECYLTGSLKYGNNFVM